jgi:dTDP-4-amino-4,6-dideoxygalactose transaminase
VAEAMSRRTLALPFHARISGDDQAYVANVLADAVERAAAGSSSSR